MNVYHPEIIKDGSKSGKSVILPLAEWKDILEELEELEDIRSYDEAKLSSAERIPFADAVREIQNGYN